LKVKTTGYTELTHTIELSHEDLVAKLREGGADIPKDAAINILTKVPNSTLMSPLGALRSPIQSLVLQVTMSDRHGT
jgi:hypothetical protein